MTTPKLPPPPRRAQKRSAFSVLVGRDEAAVGQDDVGLEQVVDREPELAGQVADAAAEGDAADAGGGDDAARRRQTEGVGGMVEVAEQGAALDPAVRASGSTRTPFIAERSMTSPSSTRAEPGAVVAAAADGDDQVVVAARN